MGMTNRLKFLLSAVCFLTMTDTALGGTTWLMDFTNTASTYDWAKLVSTFGLWPTMNYTTENPWWLITTTTIPPTVSTIPTEPAEETTPPVEPEYPESMDTIFLILIIVACVVGLIITGVLAACICKMTKSKKHKKTRRLRVKPLKADQAFATVMPPPGMMGMDMGMPGLMPPMDTGMMGMPGAMDPFAGMEGAMMAPNMMDPMGGDMTKDGQPNFFA